MVSSAFLTSFSPGSSNEKANELDPMCALACIEEIPLKFAYVSLVFKPNLMLVIVNFTRYYRINSYAMKVSIKTLKLFDASEKNLV